MKKFSLTRFCPKCGKKLDSNKSNSNRTFCNECIEPDFNFKDIKITLCTSCGSFFHRNKWARFKKMDEVIAKSVKSATFAKVKVPKLSKDKSDELMSNKAGIKKDITIEVEHKKIVYDLPARLEVTLCPKCAKKDTKYFEAILQVRNINEHTLEFIRNDISKQAKKGIHLTKEVPLQKYSIKDVDFYLTNKRYAKALAEKIRKNFGGITKMNAQLFSIDWETSKNLYRLNVLVEIPPFAKGDVIKKDNDLYKIISIGDTLHVESLRTKKSTSLPFKSSYDILKPADFQIIKKFPEFEVLDPQTYYQAKLMNPTSKLEINQTIKVIVDGSNAWMV